MAQTASAPSQSAMHPVHPRGWSYRNQQLEVLQQMAENSVVPRYCTVTKLEDLDSILALCGIIDPGQRLYAICYIKAVANCKRLNEYPVKAEVCSSLLETALARVQRIKAMDRLMFVSLRGDLKVKDPEELRAMVAQTNNSARLEKITSYIQMRDAQLAQLKSSVREIYKLIAPFDAQADQAEYLAIEYLVMLNSIKLSTTGWTNLIPGFVKNLIGVKSTAEAVVAKIEAYFAGERTTASNLI